MRQTEGKLLGKVSPWEITYKGTCLLGLESSMDLAFSQAHEVESPIAFPVKKKRRIRESICSAEALHWPKCWLEKKNNLQKPKYSLLLLSLKGK